MFLSFFLLSDSLCLSLAANPLTSTFFHAPNPFQEAGLFSDHFFSTKESQTIDEKKNVFLLITVDNYTSADNVFLLLLHFTFLYFFFFSFIIFFFSFAIYLFLHPFIIFGFFLSNEFYTLAHLFLYYFEFIFNFILSDLFILFFSNPYSLTLSDTSCFSFFIIYVSFVRSSFRNFLSFYFPPFLFHPIFCIYSLIDFAVNDNL
ncbi:unnamed protein product [Acanthosepion pharaonis]|uniref:Uncharacterized protein n=1 Tax=Acanthosepion pharaonis TaxID=158019 RepID=A0A812D944_ACAPH|nr:unnamed protein product [Sepia pharaonis]